MGLSSGQVGSSDLLSYNQIQIASSTNPFYCSALCIFMFDQLYEKWAFTVNGQ